VYIYGHRTTTKTLGNCHYHFSFLLEMF